jgi:hypothetical protein
MALSGVDVAVSKLKDVQSRLSRLEAKFGTPLIEVSASRPSLGFTLSDADTDFPKQLSQEEVASKQLRAFQVEMRDKYARGRADRSPSGPGPVCMPVPQSAKVVPPCCVAADCDSFA